MSPLLSEKLNLANQRLKMTHKDLKAFRDSLTETSTIAIPPTSKSRIVTAFLLSYKARTLSSCMTVQDSRCWKGSEKIFCLRPTNICTIRKDNSWYKLRYAQLKDRLAYFKEVSCKCFNRIPLGMGKRVRYSSSSQLYDPFKEIPCFRSLWVTPGGYSRRASKEN